MLGDEEDDGMLLGPVLGVSDGCPDDEGVVEGIILGCKLPLGCVLLVGEALMLG